MTKRSTHQLILGTALCAAALLLIHPLSAQDDGWKAETRFGAKAKRVSSLIKEADDARAAGDFKAAYKKYRSVETGSINLRNRGRAVVMQGQCLWEMEDRWGAYESYRRALDNYAGFVDFDDVLAREFEVGEYYYRQKASRIWLFKMSTSAMATDIFDHIVRVGPYSDLAPKALLYSGKIAVRDREFNTASTKFRRILTQFRNSDQAPEARLALARSLLDEAREGDGDGSKIREANRHLERFLRSYPDHEHRPEAVELQRQAREVEANRLLALAEFYLRRAHSKPEAAARYLRELLAKYEGTEAEPAALEMLEQMNSQLQDTPTPDEPIKIPKASKPEKKPEPPATNSVKKPTANPRPTKKAEASTPVSNSGKFLLPIEDLGSDK
jgi:outer membrane assembly lipoprotein YfiO